MTSLISEEYVVLNRRLHAENVNFGAGGDKWAKQIEQVAAKLNSTSVLDYGCGKGKLAKALPDLPIREYDPAVPGKDANPEPADLIVCTDVLEHIEPHCLKTVIKHIQRLALKCVVLTIHTGPADKILPDGRNAHLSQKPVRWWLEQINARFYIVQMQMVGPIIFIIAR